MTKYLEECLLKLKTKFREDEEFTSDDITYGMFKRAEYNLNRLVELGYHKRRVHLFERTMNVVSYYSL
jgi:hypothetical protein